MDARKDYLHTAEMCRFCLSQDDSVVSLYARKQSSKKTVPLSLKILSTVSIQAFPSDRMPSYICSRCKFFMDVCYQFKQMAQEADVTTLQYVQSGTALEPVVWPSALVKLFRYGAKQPDPSVMKTIVEGGATVEVSSQDASDSEDDDENVYNVKIGDGTVEGRSACVKVVTSKDQDGPKSKNSKKDPELEGGRQELEGVKQKPEGGRQDLQDGKQDLAELADGCWACDQCNNTFPLLQMLELHKVQRHRARKVACDQCDSKFFNKYDLAVHHQYRHSDEAPFECAACDKKFKSLGQLKKHEKMVHSDLPQLRCPSCPASYLSMEHLNTHKLRHNRRSLPFICLLCKKRFLDKYRLQRHVAAVHPVVAGLCCKYCPERFTSVSKLARHVRSHAGERLHPCKYCDKSFTKSHHYTRHLRVKHNCGEARSPKTADEYRCEQCGAPFATQDELIYHSAIHATQNLTCPLCQEKFQNVDAVTAHIKSHVHGMEFMCALCELVFTTKDKLESHFTAAHDDEIRSAKEMGQMTWYESEGEGEEEDDDDNSINVKEEHDHMVVEIKKPNEFMLRGSQGEVEDKMNNTNSEDSEAESAITELPPLQPASQSSVKVLKSSALKLPPPPPALKPAPAAPARPAPATATPPKAAVMKTDKNDSVQTANIIRKAEEIKRKVIQQPPDTVVPAKKQKPKSESTVSGASDKSLRLLEKELQELKRTNTRNETPKPAAKSTEPRSSNRRPQIHTSTPKPRSIEEKKSLIQTKLTMMEKKVPERRGVKENKKPEETKEIKTNNVPAKEEKEPKKEEKATGNKEDVKEKSISMKNGANNKNAADDSVRRSSRPSKVKDYAKMIRDKSGTPSDDDSDEFDDDDDDDDDEEIIMKASASTESRPKPRRVVQKAVPKVVQNKATPPRKRGRPRKDVSQAVPAKTRKEDNDSEKQDTEEDEDMSKTAKKTVENQEADDTEDTDNSKQAEEETKPPKTVTTPPGPSMKKGMVPIKTLPPGVKPLPLPANARHMGSGELCEMQIGKKMVKVQKIVMSKAEVEAMAKKGLLEMKDGTMVLKQGIKIPTADPIAIKSTLVGEDVRKESPIKQDKAAPTRCDLDDA